MRRYLLFCMLLLTAYPIQAQEKSSSDEPTVQKGVVFGKGGDKNLELNLAIPPGKGPFPAIVVVHGGGWKSGSYKDALMNMIMMRIVKQGYVGACIQYRLTPSGARFPAQIEDCKCAVRWLRGNAEKYQIDTNRIGALGGSAGAHLVLLLGLTTKEDGLEGNGDLKPEFAQFPSTVHAVVNIFGPSDLLIGNFEPGVQPLLTDLLGGTVAEKTALAKQASPLTYVQAGRKIPPILTFHGTKDPIVPYVHATKLHAALDKLHSPCKLVTMEGEGHGWGGEKLEKTLQETVSFLNDNVKGKK